MNEEDINGFKDAVRTCRTRDRHNREVAAGQTCPGCGVSPFRIKSRAEIAAMYGRGEARGLKPVATVAVSRERWALVVDEMKLTSEESDALFDSFRAGLLEEGVAIAEDDAHAKWIKCAKAQDWGHVSREVMAKVAAALGWST